MPSFFSFSIIALKPPMVSASSPCMDPLLSRIITSSMRLGFSCGAAALGALSSAACADATAQARQSSTVSKMDENFFHMVMPPILQLLFE